MTGNCFNETETEEREYLEGVIRKVASELSAFAMTVNAREAEARDMMVELQEMKREMDHVEKASVRQSVNVMTRVVEHGVAQQRRLERLLQTPYFGRIDITSSADPQVRPIYIGIHALHDGTAEAQLIHDWRAPISSMFYEFELGDAHYDAPDGRIDCRLLRKRQYRIENKKLVFMLETSLNIQDDILQKELSRASDEKMRNIVATIQRDQNAIIRNDHAHTLIIQGAAGSGKTSIALHRIAFLLYKYRDSIRSEDILIISPNKVFAHYISQVLPELGEEMIQQTTMELLATKLLGPKFRFQTFAEQVALLLDGRDQKYAERVRFKGTAEFRGKLDDYIQHFRTTNFKARDVEIGLYSLPAEWLAARFGNYRKLPIGEQITRVLDEIVEHVQTRYHKQIVGAERTKLRAELKSMFSLTTLPAIYKEFFNWLGQPGMFKQIRGGTYEYADVFPLIHLQKLADATFAANRVKHVVIDEMQDYTPIQYQLISALYPCRKTILGDHNQSVSPATASSAEGIEQILPQAQCMYMHKSYRSSIEITQLAQSIHPNPNLIPIERHGEKPAIIVCKMAEQEVNWIIEAVRNFRSSDYNSMGIICKTQEQAEWLYQRFAGSGERVRLLDARSTVFSQGVMIATAYLAKGLEFDQVVVPFSNDAEYNTVIGRHMLYVACTRAMHKLDLTCTGEPSRFLQPSLQGGLASRRCAQT